MHNNTLRKRSVNELEIKAFISHQIFINLKCIVMLNNNPVYTNVFLIL